MTVAGTICDQDRPFNTSGYQANSAWKLARFATVELLDQDDAVLGTTFTGNDGRYSFSEVVGPRGTRTRIRTQAASEAGEVHYQWPGGVQWNIYQDTSEPSESILSSGNYSLNRDIHISENSAAWNIMDMLVAGYQFALSWMSEDSERSAVAGVDAIWDRGDAVGTEYNPISNNLYIGSGGSYDDDFNDIPILHEYGHFVTDIASTFDVFLGNKDHYWDSPSPGESEMAWNEGLANFFCAAAANEYSSAVSAVGVPAGNYVDVELGINESSEDGSSTRRSDVEGAVAGVRRDLYDLAADTGDSYNLSDGKTKLFDLIDHDLDGWDFWGIPDAPDVSNLRQKWIEHYPEDRSLIDPIFIHHVPDVVPFEPYFDDVMVINPVDEDNDGYMREFEIAFDVDSSVAGNYYIEIWEDDPSIAGWGDDYIWTSPNYIVEGAEDDYHAYTVITDNHSLGHGESEFVIKLFNSSSDELIEILHKDGDSDLGNVLVEYEYQDAGENDFLRYFSEALIDTDWEHQRVMLNLGLSMDVDPWIKMISCLAAPSGPVAAGLYGLAQVLDVINTNVHFGLSLDLADLFSNTKDNEQGYFTVFLTAGASLVDISVERYLEGDLMLDGNISLTIASIVDPYEGEPDLGDMSLVSISGSAGPLELSVEAGMNFVNVGESYEFESPSEWDFDAGLKLLDFDYPFLSFDINLESLFDVLIKTGLKGALSAMFNAVDAALFPLQGIHLPTTVSPFSLTDILLSYVGDDEPVPPIFRPAWPEESGYLSDFVGGIDFDGDGLGDCYYPELETGQEPTPNYPYLSFCDANNTGTKEDDFFIEVEDVPEGWIVEAADGWTYDRKFDVTNVPALSSKTTRWIIAPEEGAQDSKLRFDLFHDGFGFWANEYKGSLFAPVHVANLTSTIQITDASLTEGNSGTKNFDFTVSLSNPSSQTVTVNYATADNSAVAPGDYTAKTGTLTFAPGETTKPVSVSVNGDTTWELNEEFWVLLSGATNAVIVDNKGIGTVLNDDQQRDPNDQIPSEA